MKLKNYILTSWKSCNAIGQMSMDEAKQVLLGEAEKEARNDMARIIRQIESEARSEGEKRARGSSLMPFNVWPPNMW
jgi:hypothetical protein